MNMEAILSLPPGWQRIERDGVPGLEKVYTFPQPLQVMAFANAIAFLALRMDHHPELTLGIDGCRVRWSTHDLGGLGPKDYTAAGRVDRLLD